ELQFNRDPGNVVGGNIRAQDGGEMKNLELGFFQLVVSHGTIAGAKVNRTCNHLPYTTPAANGLVVDLNLRVELVIFAEPLRIHGVGESGAGSIQSGLSC